MHIPVKPNNPSIVLEPQGYPENAHTLISHIQNSFIFQALTTKIQEVPESYITQFWLSAELLHLEGHGMCVTRYATHQDADDII